MRALLLLLAVLSLGAVPAQAQSWPTKPVKLVVSYPPGGSLDAIARPFAEALGKHFGQPFVIENRAGAAGALGTEVVARSTPDGYTLLAGPNAPITLLPLLRKTPYQPTDLVPVAPMGEFVYAFSVLNKMNISTMAELVALAKQKPGTLSYGSPGAGSATNLRGEAFKILAGVDILHVPYRTGAEVLIDFLAGTVDVMIDNVQFPHVKAGKAKLLAVTSSKRHPDFPDVPTLAEAGYPVRLDTWSGIFAPKGVPPEVMDAISTAMAKINKDPEMNAKVLSIGFFPMDVPGSVLRERLAGELADYVDWVKKTGIKIE